MSIAVYSSRGTMQFLQVPLRSYGNILATRDSGRVVAAAISEHTDEPVSFILDFADLGAVGPPALDEILTALEAHLRRHRDNNVTVLAMHLEEPNRATLELVVENGPWPGIAHRSGKGIELLGARPQLIETLEAAKALGPFTAPQLAEHLDLKLPNTNQRLKLLLQAGAVGRVPDNSAEHGTRYEYFLPQLKDADLALTLAGDLARRGAGRRR